MGLELLCVCGHEWEFHVLAGACEDESGCECLCYDEGEDVDVESP